MTPILHTQTAAPTLPIVRLPAFSAPAFTLATRRYGGDYNFTTEESAATLNARSIRYNRAAGQKLVTTGDAVYMNFVNGALGGTQTPISELTTVQLNLLVDNYLAHEEILALNFEAHSPNQFITDESVAPITPAIDYICSRLKVTHNVETCNTIDEAYRKWSFNANPSERYPMFYGFYGSHTAPLNNKNQNWIIDKWRDAHDNPSAITLTYPYTRYLVSFGYTNIYYNGREGDHDTGIALHVLFTLDALSLFKKKQPSIGSLLYMFPSIDAFYGDNPNDGEIVQFAGGYAKGINKRTMYPPNIVEDMATLGSFFCKNVFYWNYAAIVKNSPSQVANMMSPTTAYPAYQWVSQGGSIPVGSGNQQEQFIANEMFLWSAMTNGMERYSRIQSIVEGGVWHSVPITYTRKSANGSNLAPTSVPAPTNEKWFNTAVRNDQAFGFVVTNGASRLFVFWDLYAPVGAASDTVFSFIFNGQTYNGSSNENRLGLWSF